MSVTKFSQLRRAVPEHTLDALDRYINHGLPPGGFLTAVLENNLFQAYANADYINQLHMHDIIMYIYNECPSSCWGYEGVVDEWCERVRNSDV